MIRLRRKIAAGLLLACLVLSSCTGGGEAVSQASEPSLSPPSSSVGPPSEPPPEPEPGYQIDGQLPSSLRELVLENRDKIFTPLDERVLDRARALLTQELDPDFDRQIAAIVAENTMAGVDPEEMTSMIPPLITHTMAQEEIWFLFHYLRYGYCGYEYLGGDEVFFAVWDEMLEAVASHPDPMDIYTYKYEVLVPGLESVIRDSHFTLDGERFTASYERPYFLYSEAFPFAKTPEGYQAELDGRIVSLASVDGEPPEEWLLPFLSDSGEIVWVVGRNDPEPDPVRVDLVLEERGSGELVTQELVLEAADYDYREEFDPAEMGYRLEEAGGIPVMVNRRLYTTSGDILDQDDVQLNQMIADASGLGEEPVLIIDLRGNPGGDDSYCFRWLQNYAGTNFSPNYSSISTSLLTETVRSSAEWIVQFLGDQFNGVEGNHPPYWRELSGNAARPVKNDNLVFVLMDNAVASSGESFVAALREMDNVVLVGTNTAGCGTMGNIRGIFLPQSKLILNCGITFFLQPDLSDFEGVGYQPDIWAPPGEALDRVVAFIRAQQLAE